jgi:PAS domain S-box-containing protein
MTSGGGQVVQHRLREDQLRSALDAAGIGAWVFHHASDELMCSAACARLFGLPPIEMGTTLDSLLSHVHPDDRAAVAAALRRAGEDSAVDIEFRVVVGDGELRWLSVKGHDFAEEPFCTTGIVSDVSDHRMAESQLRHALQRLEFHVQNSPLAVIEWDYDFRVVRWSLGAERIFGWSADDVLGKHPYDWRFVHEDDRGQVDALMAELVGGEKPRNRGHNRNYTKTGRVVHCDWQNSALLDERGRLRSLLSLVLDVTTRVEIEEAHARVYDAELAARRAAESANHAKDEFLAILSHELRTPLTAILGWTGVLRARGGDPKMVGRALETIERNAQSQARIVEDVLETSRIVAGKLRLSVGDTDPHAVLDASLDSVRPTAEGKDVIVDVEVGPDVGRIRADADRLQQVFWNLLSNAVKFAPRGGHVTVHLAREGGSVVLRVTDDGPGIAPDFLPFVFERFRQAESSTTRSHAGLGLGLAIAKHLVDLHGGTIEVRSEGLGRGATFRVALPCSAVTSACDAAREASTMPASRCEGGQALRGVSVLVVEDDPDARELVARLLADHGANVMVAGDACDALRILESRPVDVLVADIGLPGEDGYSMMNRVRARCAEKMVRGLPALALTAYASAEDARRASVAGFGAHLAKPFEAGQLIRLVAGLAEGSPSMNDMARAGSGGSLRS